MINILLILLLTPHSVIVSEIEGEKGHFYCTASDLIQVEVMGSYSLEQDNPLGDEFILSIQEAGFFLGKDQVTRYRNAQSEGGHEFVLEARHRSDADAVLSLETKNGTGSLHLRGWGVRKMDAELTCTFSGIR